MAGVYVHIPFCRRACHYCDFHFTTNLKNTDQLVNAILKEIEIRRDYLKDEVVNTIYFGGGTPSLLPTSSIEQILNAISQNRSISDRVEFTLEANPEDLTSAKLKELKTIGVNRLSLGTQSFIDSELKWMNRMHSSDQAIACIAKAQSTGFENISIDLIYGLPNQTTDNWQLNLDVAVDLNIQHVSSYSLTVEPKTVLSNRISKGEQIPPVEEVSAACFEMNMNFLPENGFEHYETSNFAKEGFISRHNSSYWLGESYIGFGPSAHSFNGYSRQWNMKSNGGYIQRLSSSTHTPFFESEQLTISDQINEHIMTGFRSKWGVQKEVLENVEKGTWNRLLQNCSNLDSSHISVENDRLFLTDKGKLYADLIASHLFVE